MLKTCGAETNWLHIFASLHLCSQVVSLRSTRSSHGHLLSDPF